MSKDSTKDLYKLISQISVYALGKRKPDAVTVRRMKNTAAGFIKDSAANCATARGLIACIEGHYEEAVKQHTLATKLNKNPHHVMHYAVSMRTLGYPAEAYRLVQSVMSQMPDQMGLLSAEISLSFESGHYEDVLRFHDEMLRIKLENVPTNVLLFVYFSNLLLERNIESSVFPVIANLFESIHDKYQTEPFDSYAIEFNPENKGELFYWVTTTADEQTIAVMNAELASEIALLKYDLDDYHTGFRAPQTSSAVISTDKLNQYLFDMNAQRTQSRL